jgi:hypothetical protein
VKQELAPTGADFGVVIATTRDHAHWARGTCASVRAFMDDVPICVLMDGEGDTGDFEAYGARVLRTSELDDSTLRGLGGSTKVKQAMLWAAPFERFLFLDSDTIVWGDVRELADLEAFDFVVDAPLGAERARRSVMDPVAVGRHFPSFDARRHLGDFVNSGAYFARRGAVELDSYLELLRFSRRHPDVFLFGDQGVFNFMVFSGADAGVLRVDQRALQARVGHMSRAELERRFAFAEGVPLVTSSPAVIHWVGVAKPRMRSRDADFFGPMSFFRRRFREELQGGAASPARIEARLRFEDLLCGDWRGTNLRGRLRAARRRVDRRTRHRTARLKVALKTLVSGRD